MRMSGRAVLAGWRRYRCCCGHRWETPVRVGDVQTECPSCDGDAVAVTESVGDDHRE